MGEWWAWGLNAIPALQSWGAAWIAVMRGVSLLGTEQIYMFALPAILWCVDAQLGIRIGFLLLSSGWLNSALKLAAALPRPYWVSHDVAPLAVEASYGLPSGHAQTTTAVYGGLASSLRRRWLTVAVSILLFLIGLSRLVLGVHFAADVLAGWLIGGLILWVFLRFEPLVLSRLFGLGRGLRLALPFLVSLVMVSVGFAARASALGQMLPQEWVMNAMRADPHGPMLEPRAAADILNPAATFFGFGLGALLLAEWGRFDGRGPAWNRIGRFAVGVAGTVVLYYGLRAILPSGEDLAGYLARYARYAAVGVWLSYLAPRLFVRLRLA